MGWAGIAPWKYVTDIKRMSAVDKQQMLNERIENRQAEETASRLLTEEQNREFENQKREEARARFWKYEHPKALIELEGIGFSAQESPGPPAVGSPPAAGGGKKEAVNLAVQSSDVGTSYSGMGGAGAQATTEEDLKTGKVIGLANSELSNQANPQLYEPFLNKFNLADQEYVKSQLENLGYIKVENGRIVATNRDWLNALGWYSRNGDHLDKMILDDKYQVAKSAYDRLTKAELDLKSDSSNVKFIEAYRKASTEYKVAASQYARDNNEYNTRIAMRSVLNHVEAEAEREGEDLQEFLKNRPDLAEAMSPNVRDHVKASALIDNYKAGWDIKQEVIKSIAGYEEAAKNKVAGAAEILYVVRSSTGLQVALTNPVPDYKLIHEAHKAAVDAGVELYKARVAAEADKAVASMRGKYDSPVKNKNEALKRIDELMSQKARYAGLLSKGEITPAFFNDEAGKINAMIGQLSETYGINLNIEERTRQNKGRAKAEEFLQYLRMGLAEVGGRKNKEAYNEAYQKAARVLHEAINNKFYEVPSGLSQQQYNEWFSKLVDSYLYDVTVPEPPAPKVPAAPGAPMPSPETSKPYWPSGGKPGSLGPPKPALPGGMQKQPPNQ